MCVLQISLAVDETVSCDYVVAHTDAGSYDNTAKVTVSDNEGNNASDQRSEERRVGKEARSGDLTKSVDPSTLAEPGGDFTFTLKIHNTSVEPVTIDALTDDNTLSQDGLILVHSVLAVETSVSCDYVVAHTDAGSYDNTAKVTVSDNEGNNASDQ